jgi:hypothetical protein
MQKGAAFRQRLKLPDYQITQLPIPHAFRIPSIALSLGRFAGV